MPLSRSGVIKVPLAPLAPLRHGSPGVDCGQADETTINLPSQRRVEKKKKRMYRAQHK